MQVHDLTILGSLHSLACLVALICGARNLVMAKGTPLHRFVGRVYVFDMIFANMSSLFIYRFDIAHFVPFSAGPNVFGFFHWLAVTTLVLIAIGWYAGRHQASRVWAYVHPTAMILSYYMLIGGGINEVFARVDVLRTMAVASAGSVAKSANAPIIGHVQALAMATTLLFIAIFAVKVALHRRHLRRQACRHDSRPSQEKLMILRNIGLGLLIAAALIAPSLAHADATVIRGRFAALDTFLAN